MDDFADKPPEDAVARSSPQSSDPQKEDYKSADDLVTLYDKGSLSVQPGDHDPADPEEELGGRMGFLAHLEELRRRILYCVAALAVSFTVSWIFHEAIFGFLAAPIKEAVNSPLYFTKPTEPFTIYLKVSFTAAIFLAIPFLLLQIWLFIAPGLYRREKAYALPFILSSTILFLLGGGFAYYIILGPALDFLINQFGREFQPIVTAVDYFDFILVILVGMGAMFQLPILVASLSIFGLVTAGFLWRNFRYAVLLIVIVAAVVSPTTDPFSLLLWSGPMILLYLLSILVAFIFQRSRARRERTV